MPELDLKSSPVKEHTLLIWDTEGPPPAGNWTKTVLWSSFGDNNDLSVVSLPTLVEEQADVIRARYLTWIYELGETRIRGKKLVDHMVLRNRFSYWWMTSLAQKFNASGTSQINDAIKAFALESLIAKYTIGSIDLISSNSLLALTLKNLCRNLGLNFQWNYLKQTKMPRLSVKLLYHALPYPFQALIYFFVYLFKTITCLYNRKPVAIDNPGISFIDVLVHLDRRAFKKGTFISNYWTSLVDMLSDSNVKTNWLHNYFYQKEIPSFSRAQELLRCFNNSNSKIQSHSLIESNLNLSVFAKALKDYFRTSWVSFRLSEASRNFVPAGSALDFWPLFKDEWIDSLRGNVAMINCLRVSLYEKIFSHLPYQKLGCYIQENQPWEMALIHAWKAAGHGKLVGVPHTTVRFWDLRYFYDPRSYARTGNNDLPTPDLVAVNGPSAKKTYLDGGYPESQIAEVEALRFIHLLKRNADDTSAKSTSMPLNVLICGDFLAATNNKMLSWLLRAAQSLPPETSYVFKPHPAYPVKLSDYSTLKLEETNALLSELFAKCDVVFTSNITSAAVDAYCSGIPVVQMLDGKTFNMSPLRGLTDVMYVTNPLELAEALLHVKNRESVVPEPYFYLDEQLPRWRQLLGLSKVDNESSVTI